MNDEIMSLNYSLIPMFNNAKVFPFYSVDSTNEVAKELATRIIPEGSIVISEMQSSGRGRRGREWYSPPYKGLWFSIVIYPSVFPQELGKITILAGLSVVRAVRKLGVVDAWLKWPNDVMAGSKKLSGILVEAGIEYDIVNYVVVGIGVNVNHDESEIPQELTDVMTSMKLSCGKEFLRAIVLSEILRNFRELYLLIRSRRFHVIREMWERESGFVGRVVEVMSGDEKVSGIVEGLSDEGSLLVKGENGLIREIWMGEVSKVRV